MRTDQPNWMTPYFDHLLNGILPNDGVEAWKIKKSNHPSIPFTTERYIEKLPCTMAKMCNTKRRKVHTTRNTCKRSAHA